MACAFQSGTASVYLEIQWWFVKAPEPSDSEEDIDAQEVQGNLSLSLSTSLSARALSLSRVVRGLLGAHPLMKEIRASSLYPLLFRTSTLCYQTSSLCSRQNTKFLGICFLFWNFLLASSPPPPAASPKRLNIFHFHNFSIRGSKFSSTTWASNFSLKQLKKSPPQSKQDAAPSRRKIRALIKEKSGGWEREKMSSFWILITW